MTKVALLTKIIMKQKTTDRQLAPIVLTVYKRPWHTEQTLNALKANDLADQSILYIYSDGPKHLATAEDLAKIEEVRQLARSEAWCKEVHIIESPLNIGLYSSFVKAVTEVVNKHGKVIVLEDDQVTSKGFLKYMNEALDLYENEPQVMHVSAYMYPAKFESKNTTFFLNIQSCPGWGTWKRAWQHFNPDAKDHLRYFSQNVDLKRKFDIEGNAYFFRQLEMNAGPVNYSFAVLWYASCFRAGGLSLFPKRSLIQNVGLDGTGEHVQAGIGSMYKVEPVDYLEIEHVPIIEDEHIRHSVDQFYKEKLGNYKQNNAQQRLRNWQNFLNRLGANKAKRAVRWVMRRIYPEFSVFELPEATTGPLKSIVKGSKISSLAKLYPPYRVIDSQVGDYTYISESSIISKTTIGKFCSIGPKVMCGWGVHPVVGVSTSPMFYSINMQNGTTLSPINKVQERKPIHIGNDVFIGMNVTILDGINIGDGAIIGAGTVVSKNVPPYAIVVGNSMRILRYRFPEETIKKLLEIAWWDWPLEELYKVEKYFFDVDGFISCYGNQQDEIAEKD